MKCVAFVVCLAGLTPILQADGLPVGTWVRRANQDGVNISMIIEAVGTGRRITMKVGVPGGATSTMMVTTQVDGKDVPVLVDGKPSSQTMAIRMIDDRHTVNIMKMNGNPIMTQKSEISADGKVIKDESTSATPGGQTSIQYWDKK